MRGIERVLAAILLVAAVGGAAVFARESGSGLAGAVHLAAPPQQHLAAPGSVLIAPTASADHSQQVLRQTVSPQFTIRPAGSAHGAPLGPVTTVRSKRGPQPQAPTPTRTSTPAPAPAPAPAGPTPAPAPTPTPTANPTPTPMTPPLQPVAAPAPEPRSPAAAQPAPAPAPTPTPTAPIKATPVTPVAVTSDNVQGIAPSPGLPVTPPTPIDNGDGNGGAPQAMHIKGVGQPNGN